MSTYTPLVLSRTAHPLAALLAIVLLIPGLLAGLSLCGMPECPAMATASVEHHCSQASSTVLSAACCRVDLGTPATPLRTSERAETSLAVPQSVSVPALLSASLATAGFGLRPPLPVPLDALSQSSVLRI